ncbi:amidohydrolase family protein [Kitasatospora sp. NPDC048540]|uniref:amidohydrolase family protein n=1 Tax=unclassified Kitasatospora TaxID=2633591 RepID=UPI00068F269C|nr:amidohydrolase family protein [Kitasatospora sp. MBT63]
MYEVAGRHVELYLEALELADLLPVLSSLPAVSVDHLGLSAAGLPSLLRLVGSGAKVKARGFGRVSLDIDQTVRAIVRTNPTALMFGSDLPSTRAPRPFEDGEVQLLAELAGAANVNAVLHDNAAAFYRIAEHPLPGRS